MSRDRSSRWTKRFKTLVALVLSLQLLTFSGGLVSAASAQEAPPSQTDSPTPPPSPEPSPSPSPSATATLLLTTVPGLTAAQQTDLVTLHGATLESSIPVLRMLFVSVPADSVQFYMDSFASDLAVESVDADRTREAEATPSDPSYGDQWALPKIGWDQAHGSVTPSGSSTIAVLDTGVDASVADLSGRILSGYSAFGTDPATDPNGHGTWLASIAAAATDNGSGIAGVDFANVNVMPVQVLDASGTGQDGDIIAGVVYAVDHGADVILMGFSNPGRSDALQAAVDYAWSHGAVLVAAAGNDGSTSPTFPAGLAKVVGVAATDQSDSLWSGSNSSQAAFISAPGVDISADDASGVVSITGTSASAAIVAGTAALLKSNTPGTGPGVIVGRLARNTDAGGAGNGRLNLARSLGDNSTDPVVPTGAPGGGPVVGPYHAATNGTITGTVTDSSTGLPISGATVSCAVTPTGCNNIASTTTAANGTYSLAIQYGGSTATASVTASASGHTSVTANVSVANNAGARNFSLAPSNTAPSAVNKTPSTNEDVAVGVTLTGSDAQQCEIVFSIVSPPTNGTLGSISNNACVSGSTNTDSASVTYSPNPNYNGSDSFTYKVNDGTLDSASASVSITVNAVNDAPSFTKGADQTVNEDAGNQSVSAWATAISKGPANESGQTVDFIVTNDNNSLFSSQPTVSATGTLTYTSAANANGSAIVTVKIHDDGGTTNGGVDTSAARTFTITVTAVNDVPLAAGQLVTTNEDTAKIITLSATDMETCELTFSIVTGPTHGSLGTITGNDCVAGSPNMDTASITYTPAANYHGSDSFTFKVNDGTVNSNTPTISITVTSVNDTPTADDQAVSATEDIAKTISLTGSDADGDALTFSIVTGPSHGTLGLIGTVGCSGVPSSCSANVTYTPDANYNGSDSFGFRVNDGSVYSSAATVSITVAAVNDLPSADAKTATTDEDAPKTVTLTGSDTEGSALTFSIVSGPSHGTLGSIGTVTCSGIPSSCSADVIYTPAADYNGSDSFTYKVNDGTDDSNTATVSITVNAVDDAPVCQDVSITTAEDTAGEISTNCSDVDSATLTYTVTVATNGTSGFAANRITYSPNANYNGPDSFTYTANDGTLDSNAAEVDVTVSAVNDAPVAVDDANSTNEDTAVATDVISNDTDVDNTNAQLSVKPGSLSATNGSATLDADGRTIHFTPDLNKNDGNVNAAGFTVTYKAIDGTDDSNTATLTISVSAVNDAPVAVDDANSTNEDTAVATDVISNDTDVDNTNAQLSVKPGSLSATNGSATLDADGRTIHFTPDLNKNDGNVNAAGFTVTYKAIDGTDDSNTATLTISVSAVNDAPGFDKGADQTVDEDAGAQTVPGWATNISAGPSDESSQTVTFIVTNNTNSGLFTGPGQPAVSSNGALTYTPAANANGTAIITLKAHDSGGTANGGVNENATQNFMIAVNAVNDAPSFTKGGDKTVNEDAGAQSVSGWATIIAAGPSNESSQTVDFIVTNNNSALFSAQPAVSVNGTLTYTSAANANGSATVTVKIHDDGGTAHGGVDTSAGQTFTINVTAVNDAPSFTKGADQTVAEDSGPHAEPSWATNISPGPSDESGQNVDFIVTNNNSALFSAQPAVSANGTLTYTSATNANGTATVTVKIHDNGGTANGAVNESATQTFTITVSPVNDAPVITSATFGVTNVPCPATAGGTNATLTVTFTDADSGDTHSATIDWDNNPATTGDNQNVGPVTSPFSRSHSYPAGMYTAMVTVTDAGGLSDSKTASIKVNYNASGILQPVNDTQAHNDPSIFKFGSTIPVKVQFFNCDGTIASSTLNVKIEVRKTSGSTPNSGVDETITNTNSPDSGSYMRWSGGMYLYNLNTKSLSDSSASYHITITVESTGQTVETDFGTKAK